MRSPAADPYEKVEKTVDRLEPATMNGLARGRAVAALWLALALWLLLDALVLAAVSWRPGR